MGRLSRKTWTVSAVLYRVGILYRIDVPAEASRALGQVPGAEALFARLTVNLRREFIEWINAAKQPVTGQRRIETGIIRLLEKTGRAEE